MKRFEHQWQDFKWTDIESPTQEDFVRLAEEFEIPFQPLATSLDSEHLPKFLTLSESVSFMILRLYDVTAKHQAGTMQDLSTKLILFFGKDFLLTIHRMPLECIEEKKMKCSFEQLSLDGLIKSLFIKVIATYDKPLDEVESKTQVIESRVFTLRRRNILREGYLIKRRTSVFKKIFKFTTDVLNKLQTVPGHAFQDMEETREPLEKYSFYADSIYEDITGLLNLHLSLMSQKTNEASYKTNEIMRILTVVSIFFLPLNFIAGVYGMNFEHMPELKIEQGYHMTLLAMFLIAVAIFAWIYKKGWLTKDDL
ncbi:magnesium and cobalt transport protein [Bdellovibrio sp. PAP01]|uniref:Magnesium and cobalt transport protein n=2 Tax=Bdellovibrio svalbardensis TaxID=2972972 RepID=A0ABT6DM60_9BACT|nr:magnesium and cobalt transport protein [Bdellovibrio svalbardensis]